MTETCRIPLTYLGVLGHRGIRISRDSYGKTWTLDLVGGMWTLADHNGENLHAFTQKDLHSKVLFPGFSRGYRDLYLTGLGRKIYCFQPEVEVVGALKHYAEESERANAPQLAKWYRCVGIGFLGLAALALAGCVAALYWALGRADISGSFRLSVALALILPGLFTSGYFGIVGVQELLRSKHFVRIAAAGESDVSKS